MSTLTEPGNSIEGAQLSVSGLKIEPARKPEFCREANQIVFPISVKRRGDSIIIKEYDPRVFQIRETSNLELNDQITGLSIWGFCSKPVSQSNVKKGGEGRSSSHTGQELVISGTCYMTIIESLTNSAIEVHPKKVLLG